MINVSNMSTSLLISSASSLNFDAKSLEPPGSTEDANLPMINFYNLINDNFFPKDCFSTDN